jgi:HEAT repeat protein
LGRLVLRDMDAGVRARAAQALGQIGDKAAWQPEVLSALVQALQDADADVRFRAAEALGQMMAQGVRLFRRRWGKIEGKRVDELATLRE